MVESLERYDFASDNTAGVCPEAWEALCEAHASAKYSPAYGNDPWTQKACDLLRETFEKKDCEVFFIFNGTAANSLAVAAMCQPYHGLVCHPYAHLIQDECHAPAFFSSGVQLIPVAGSDPLTGKLCVDAMEKTLAARRPLHSNKTRAISLTQSTELGTVYQPHELHALSRFAKKHELFVHMDGARFANAVASLQCSPAEISWKAGVDILCLGGTKNGMFLNEAVLIFNPDLAREFDYRLKQAGQLASKMRYLAAPWLGMLQNQKWLEHARHANHCANMLAEGLNGMAGFKVTHFPVEANAVFVEMSDAFFKALHDKKGWHFYKYFEENGYRLVCSWATQPEAVQQFLSDCRALSANVQ